MAGMRNYTRVMCFVALLTMATTLLSGLAAGEDKSPSYVCENVDYCVPPKRASGDIMCRANCVGRGYNKERSGCNGEISPEGECIVLCKPRFSSYKTFNSLLSEVNKLMDETEMKVQKENYCRIIDNSVDDLGKLKKEVEVLKNEVLELKNVQRTQADVMKAKEKQWAEEKETLKEEKKKLEYMLFDLLKVSEANKEKVKRIKAVCDE